MRPSGCRKQSAPKQILNRVSVVFVLLKNRVDAACADKRLPATCAQTDHVFTTSRALGDILEFLISNFDFKPVITNHRSRAAWPPKLQREAEILPAD